MRPVIAGAALLLWAQSADASPSYPGAIADELGLDCGPHCTLCHETAKGGFATANRPFGIAARRAGLECCDTSLLPGVLAEIEADGHDADEDGEPDIDELRAFTDPNVAGDEPLTCAPEEKGCSCSFSGRPRGGGLGEMALALSSALLAARRFTRRRRPRRAPRTPPGRWRTAPSRPRAPSRGTR